MNGWEVKSMKCSHEISLPENVNECIEWLCVLRKIKIACTFYFSHTEHAGSLIILIVIC